MEIELIETFSTPPGPPVVTQTECTEEPGHHPRVVLSGRTYYPDPLTLQLVLQSVPRFSKHDLLGSTGFVRADGVDLRAMVGTVDGTSAGAITLPNDDRCVLQNTSVRELMFESLSPHHDFLSLQQAIDHPGHSFALQNPQPPPQSLFARIAWRQHIGSIIAFQVAWELSERDDTDCLDLINSLAGDNGAPQVTAAASEVCASPECL